MIWIFLVWVIFVINLFAKKQLNNFFLFLKSIDKKILLGIAAFFLAGCVSLFAHGLSREKLGQFIVLFVQPISLFFIFGYAFHQNPKNAKLLQVTYYVLLAAAGLYAAFQYFTLHGLPPQYWGNSQEPKRALSFFGHPDFYALFVAPLLAFLLPDLFLSLQTKNYKLKTFLWLLGALGLLLSLSRAGWIGLAAAVFFFAIFSGNKLARQLIFAGAIAIILIVAAVPNLRYRLILPFLGEKSAVSRLSLWHTGWKGISESPIVGLGLDGFSNNWSKLNTDPNLDSHNFPHNVFLDMWVDLGLLGLLSFVWICGLYLYRGFRSVSSPSQGGVAQSAEGVGASFNLIKFAISLFLLCLLVQGQFDNPYFRNDLALVFWIILSLII